MPSPRYKPTLFRNVHTDNRRGENYMLPAHMDADPRMARLSAAEQAVVRRQIDALPAGATVADVPCGNGRMSQWVARRADLKLVAMDFNLDMLQGMAHREEPGLMPRRVQADVLHLPLADQSVDLLINMRLLHHIQDRDTQLRMLREIARVTRGRVVTSFWTTHCWRYARRRLLGKVIRGFPIPPRHFRDVCEEAGLVIEQSFPTTRWIEEQVNVVCRVHAGVRQ